MCSPQIDLRLDGLEKDNLNQPTILENTSPAGSLEQNLEPLVWDDIYYAWNRSTSENYSLASLGSILTRIPKGKTQTPFMSMLC